MDNKDNKHAKATTADQAVLGPTHYQHVVSTPIGELTLLSDGEALTGLRFAGQSGFAEQSRTVGTDVLPSDATGDPPEVLRKAATQLKEYLRGSRNTFDVPLAANGTAFQQRVWEALAAIPFGETRTYGQIASAVGNRQAVRAVGGANNANPIPIFIPCHRVVGSNGKLTGYSGGLTVKEWLLHLEGGDAQPPVSELAVSPSS